MRASEKILKAKQKKYLALCILGLLFSSTFLHADEEMESSIDYLTRAIVVDPKDTDAYFSRGYSYLTHGDYDKAIADFTQSIQISPEDALNYYFRGRAKMFKGDNRGGIEDFTKTLRINPNHVDSLLQRAQIRKKVNETSYAEEDLNLVIQLNPSRASAYEFRGLIKNEKRDIEGALNDFKRAVELDPFASQSFEEMAWIYLASEEPSLRNLELARKCAEQAYQIEKKDEIQHLLACTFSDEGNFEKAEQLENDLSLRNKDPLYLQLLENFRKKIPYTQFLKMEQQKIDDEKKRQLREQERRNRIWEEIVEKNKRAYHKNSSRKQNTILPQNTLIPNG